tara:strand:+ start:1870 stop:2370 length:501 start_codon:yes stop_codon:yes gene_type:complete
MIQKPKKAFFMALVIAGTIGVNFGLTRLFSIDDPLKGTWKNIGSEKVKIGRVSPGVHLFMKDKSFISRFPKDLQNLPRFVYRYTHGNQVQIELTQKCKLYASFPESKKIPKGWSLFKKLSFIGTKWKKSATELKVFDIYTKDFKRGELLTDLPNGWVSLGVSTQSL